jgi:hypothetical protein
MKHSIEPWHTSGDGQIYGPNPEFDPSDLVNNETILIADTSPDGATLTEQDQNNAERIVSCVNGCRGIKDPEQTVPEMATSLRAAEIRLSEGYSDVFSQAEVERMCPELKKIREILTKLPHPKKKGGA